MLHVEDLTNIDEDERAALIDMFDKHNLPHIISETHYIISSDMNHDNAMIQKLMDDFILTYIKDKAPSVSSVYVRSDGCKAQFKCAANFYWVSRQQVEGSGLRIFWSFFESCHGKCYCDPEGGTLKNAARQYELNVVRNSDQLKDSKALYRWARERSGLERPKKSLSEKKGRGIIYRRFFYWVPSKGTGAVDRSQLPKLKADGTSKLHEFVDIGVVGTVSTRRAACHQCERCWADDRHNCENKDFVGPPAELQILRENVPSVAAERINRATLNRDALVRAKNAAEGSVVCIETHKDEQTFPWVIGSVVEVLHDAPAASAPHDPQKDAVRLDPVKASEEVLKVRLYEALAPGSTTYTPSDLILLVKARSVRVIDVQLEELRVSGRVSQSRKRFKIEDDSMLAIHAEMPTSNDDWEVEAVLQYRMKYGVEQWLVKWKGYGEDHNTWEPWANLLTPEVCCPSKILMNTSPSLSDCCCCCCSSSSDFSLFI